MRNWIKLDRGEAAPLRRPSHGGEGSRLGSLSCFLPTPSAWFIGRTWTRTRLSIPFIAMALGLGLEGCGGDDLTCGSGTQKSGNQCVGLTASGGDGGSGGSNTGGTSATGGTSNTGGNPSATGGEGGAPQTDMPPEFAGALAAAPASASSLFVAWQPATDDRTPQEDLVYNVYLAQASGEQDFSTPTATSPAGASSLLLTGLDDATEYFIVVRAQDSADQEEGNTTEVSGTTGNDTEAPSFAGLQSTETVSSTSVRLTWRAGEDDKTPEEALVYLAFWSSASRGQSFGIPAAVSEPGATSMVVEGLPDAETDFFFIVRARDAAGNMDDNTVEKTGTTGADVTAPKFEGCVLASPQSASEAALAWTPAKDDTSLPENINYNIYVSETPDGFDFSTPSKVITGGNGGIVDGLKNSTTYYFVCRAEDEDGNEDENTVSRFTTTLDDSVPPVFDGVFTVKTVNSTFVEIEWAGVATDDKSTSSEIVYDAFVATTSGGQDTGGEPAASSDPGASSMTIPGLSSKTEYFIVLLARDKAGNLSTTPVEDSATTLVSFAADIETPIFGAICSQSGCHDAAQAGGMNLLPGFAYGEIVNVPALDSGSSGGKDRIEPFDPANSYLYIKVSDPSAPGPGGRMPQGLDALSTEQIDTIEAWINEGALDN